MAVTITVELNFTGSTWTDVSAFLESEVSISGGRQDELSQADANQCSFTLDNRDGRFTPGKTTGAYYPNVKVGVAVRVSVDVNGSGVSRRFTGFVDSWQLDWSDGQDACKVSVQASSIMARLGLLAERHSPIEEEYLVDGPTVYYTLGDPVGATTAQDSSGVNSTNYLERAGSGSAFVFGNATGPATDDLTALQLNGGQWLTTSSPTYTPLSLEVWFVASAGAVSWTGSTINANLYLATNGAMFIALDGGTGSLVATGGTSVSGLMDGRLHHACVVWNGTNNVLYVDGTLVSTGGTFGPSVAAGFAVGSYLQNCSVVSPVTVAHAATYTTALSAMRVADHYAAGVTAFAGESTSARFARYAAWGKVTSYSTTATAPVGADEYSGAALVDLLHNLETTEDGVLYDERDGTLTLKSRQARYAAAVAATFDASAEQLESNYAPVTDRQGLANDVTATGGDGTVVRVTDAASQAAYGVARSEIGMMNTEPQLPLARAQWEIVTHATPRERVPTLAVDVLNCGISPATLLALTVGSRVTVTNPPSQAAGPGDYFIEGWSETFDPTAYNATYNVSPAQPWVNTLILDDPTKGVLDSTYLLAY